MALLVLLAAFALRTLYLDYNDVEGDEAFSYSFSVDSLEGIIKTTLAIAEPHPIGSYFFDHFWLQLAGDSAFSFRFPSAWFGVLAAVLTYRLGRRLRLTVGANRVIIPILGAVLVTLSPFLVAESRNARMYSMSVALTLLRTWLALELIQCPAGRSPASRPRWRGLLAAAFTARSVKLLVAYISVSWLALNVHYFTGTILVAQNAFVLALMLATPLRKQSHRLARWVTAELIILVAFAPWYLQVRDILRAYPGLSYYSPPLDFMVKLMSGVFMIGQYAADWNTVFSMIGLAVILIGFFRLALAGRTQRWGALLLVCYLVVPFAMSYLDSRGRSTFAERQVIATAPGFYLLVAAAIAPALETARNRYRRSVRFIPALVLGGSRHRRDWHRSARILPHPTFTTQFLADLYPIR